MKLTQHCVKSILSQLKKRKLFILFHFHLLISSYHHLLLNFHKHSLLTALSASSPVLSQSILQISLIKGIFKTSKIKCHFPALNSPRFPTAFLRIKPIFLIMACKDHTIWPLHTSHQPHIESLCFKYFRGPQRDQALFQCGTWHMLHPRSSSYPFCLTYPSGLRLNITSLRKADYDPPNLTDFLLFKAHP